MSTTTTKADEVVERGRQRRLEFEATADAIRARTDMARPAKRRKITAAWTQARTELRELRAEYEEAQKALTRSLYDRLRDLGDADPDAVTRAEFLAGQVQTRSTGVAGYDDRMVRLLTQARQDGNQVLAHVIVRRMVPFANDRFVAICRRYYPELGAMLGEYVMRVSKQGAYGRQLTADLRTFSLAKPHDIGAAR